MGVLTILATSDLHGHLPEVPECDLFLIGGDICPLVNESLSRQLAWLDGSFRKWLTEIPAKYIVGIAGNHDFIFETPSVAELHLPWRYLQDSLTVVEGLRIYGIPWVPMSGWAFHQNDEGLQLRYGAVPRGTDIVLSHGPPFGYGDKVSMGCSEGHLGCAHATSMMRRIRPKAFVCGHIHEGFGYYRVSTHGHVVHVYNVSYVNSTLHVRPLSDPIIEIDLSADIMGDAVEDQTDPGRQVRGTDPDARSSSESAEGSDPSVLAMASAENS